MFPDKYQGWCIRYRQKAANFMKFAAFFVVKDGFENLEIRLQSF